jgi:hypothetical protein
VESAKCKKLFFYIVRERIVLKYISTKCIKSIDAWLKARILDGMPWMESGMPGLIRLLLQRVNQWVSKLKLKSKYAGITKFGDFKSGK